MGEEVVGEFAERLGKRLPSCFPVAAVQPLRVGLDVFEEPGDAPVIGFEPFDQRGDLRVRPEQRGEQRQVFQAVMALDEAAVVETAIFSRQSGPFVFSWPISERTSSAESPFSTSASRR
jgi:hypothetical protein